MEVKRSYRPLIAVISISVVAAVLTIAFKERSETVVRAPCVVYPAGYVPLISPGSLGKVTAVYKKQGDTVKAGEAILEIDSEDEKFQREAVRKQIAGLKEQIKEQEKYVATQVQLRKAQAEQAKAAEKAALAATDVAKVRIANSKMLVDVAKARVDTAKAAVNRASKGATDVEIRIAQEKLDYEIKNEKVNGEILESYKQAEKNDATTRIKVLETTVAHQKSQSLIRELRDQLKLLTDTEVVVRMDEANAELARRQAEVRSAETDVATREAEVRSAEADAGTRHAEIAAAEAAITAADVNEKAKQFQTEVDRLSVEEKRIERLITQRTMHAPTDGLIHDFRVKEGQWITDRAQLGMLYDTSSLVIYAHVQQKDFLKIAPGQQARIMFDGIPRGDGHVDATVVSLEPMAIPAAMDTIEPIALFQEPLKGAWTPRALIKLKAVEGPNSNKLRVGFTGAVKILINRDSKLADWFFKGPI